MVTPLDHQACEMCQPGKEVEHAGGYDPALNQVRVVMALTASRLTIQVFLCANNATNDGLVHGTLVRNLIQMFDACVNK